MNVLKRGRWASAMVGVLALGLFAPTAAPANAVAPSRAAAVTAERAVTSELLSRNEFGKLKSTPVTGSFNKAGKVRGTFTPRRMVVRGDSMLAVGRLDAVLRRADGSVRDRISQRVRMPVTSIAGTPLGGATSGRAAAAAPTCDVLNLNLGPLDLDLLGLRIELNEVILKITAIAGAGNLLGNLLCAVTGLLDGGPIAGLLGQIGNILNSILAILRL